MVHDPSDLAPRERWIEGNGRESPLLGGQLPAQHVDVIRQGVGEDVSGLQTPRPKSMDELVGAPSQLRERQRDTGRGGHDRWLIRVLLGEIPESEAPIPRVLHGE
jgi:hypothetical protein